MTTLYLLWPFVICCLLIPCLPLLVVLRLCCFRPKTNQDFIAQLPKYVFRGEHAEFPNHERAILWPPEKPTEIFISNSPSCPICLEEYQKDEELRLLDCAPVPHHYHQSCLDNWLLMHTTCPTCRNELDPEKRKENEAQAKLEAEEKGEAPVVDHYQTEELPV